MTQQIRLKLPNWSTNNVVLLNVRLDEHTVVRMLLDTGAKYTILTPEVARRIDINMDNAQSVGVTTATRLQTAYLVNLAQLDIHGLILNNCEVAIMDLPNALGVDGLLGMSFLRHCRLTLDMPQRELMLETEFSKTQ